MQQSPSFPVRLLCILNEYKKLREDKDKEKRRLKNHKKVQDQAEEAHFGARASPAKPAPLSGKKVERSPRMSNIGGNGQNPASRSLYLCDAATQHPGAPELTRNGNTNARFVASNGTDKDSKLESTKPATPEKENARTGRESTPKSPQFQF